MTYLILRFSSVGNVAMTVPVLSSISARYPEHQFIVVADKRLHALFYGMDNIVFHEADVRGGGLKSLWRLYIELRGYAIDTVIDLQDVLRTQVLRFLFRCQHKRVIVVDYGRAEKQALIMPGYGKKKPLKTEFERYQLAFRRAGLRSDDSFEAIAVNDEARGQVVARYGQKTMRWIGIAPFAKYESNILPKSTIKQVIQRLVADGQTRIYLFGAGMIESEMLGQWAAVMPNVVSVAGELPLQQELELMRMLDGMICMDSANQHLAALVAVRIVTVWCATHPYAGFAAWKQQDRDGIGMRVSCRPCAIHGTSSCRYHNFVCRNVEADDIITCINNITE